MAGSFVSYRGDDSRDIGGPAARQDDTAEQVTRKPMEAADKKFLCGASPRKAKKREAFRLSFGWCRNRYCTLIWICRGLASSAFATRTSRIPSL